AAEIGVDSARNCADGDGGRQRRGMQRAPSPVRRRASALAPDWTLFMPADVSMSVFFLDGTKASFTYPHQSGKDQAAIVAAVKKAIAADRLGLAAAGHPG